jgi:Holliday junction resolvase RusA-like endonuclease
VKVEFFVPGRPVPYDRVNIVGNRKLTPKRQREWATKCAGEAWAALVQSAELRAAWPIGARMALTVEVTPEDHRRADLDNYAKAVMDAVTRSTVIWADDSQVDRLTVVRMWPCKTAPGVRCVVEVL